MSEQRELRLRAADIYWQDLDGEVVALAVQRSTYLAANPAGSLLWRVLATGSTRERLARELVAAFGITEERALVDTDAFLGELSANDLLEP
jgi:hypothetical protein